MSSLSSLKINHANLVIIAHVTTPLVEINAELSL